MRRVDGLPEPGALMPTTQRERRHEFAVPFEGLLLRGDHWIGQAGLPQALLLHGGGASSSRGLAALREHLLAQGIGSLAFDFIGHGRTGGLLLGSSLASRQAQVDAVLRAQCVDPSATGVVGFSMGGHIAALSAARHQFAACALVIPAAYTACAAHLPFGPAFSAALRQPASWQDSDAFEALARYAGRLQVISAELDAVVPSDIPARYARESLVAAACHHHVIPGAGHDLSVHFTRHPEARDSAYDLIAALIRGTIAHTSVPTST